MRSRGISQAALTLWAFVCCHALAQPYPSKPIRLIQNGSVGAVSDIVMRAASQELSAQMGGPWVVENHPGGNFVIGTNACKRSAPDGYTVCLVNMAAMSLNPHALSNLPYDPDKDFKPITNLFSQVIGIVANANLRANTVGELQALAAAKPGALNFATLGPGSSADMLRQWLSDSWKAEIVGVPYKGMNLIVNAVLSGESDVTWTAMGNIDGHVKLGKVKVLAVNTAKRTPRMPQVPTLGEVGLGDFHGLVWWGLVAPAGMSDTIVRRLNAEVTRLFKEPKFAEFLDRQFLVTEIGTPEEFAAFLKTDRQRVGNMVKRLNLPRQ